MSKEFVAYRNEIIRVARQLYYSPAVLACLRNAKSESELTRIMHTARDREAYECYK